MTLTFTDGSHSKDTYPEALESTADADGVLPFPRTPPPHRGWITHPKGWLQVDTERLKEGQTAPLVLLPYLDAGGVLNIDGAPGAERTLHFETTLRQSSETDRVDFWGVTVRTDGEGRFSTDQLVPSESTYRIRLVDETTGEPCPDTIEQVRVEAGKPRRFDLAYREAGRVRVRGRFVTRHGESLEGTHFLLGNLHVRPLQSSREFIDVIQPGKDGVFVTLPYLPGRYSLQGHFSFSNAGSIPFTKDDFIVPSDASTRARGGVFDIGDIAIDYPAEAGGEEESTAAFDRGDASQVRLSVKVWRGHGGRPDELIASPVAVTLLDEWTLFEERSEIRYPTGYGLPSLPEDLVAKASGGGVVGEEGKPGAKWETNTKGVVLPPHPSGFEGRSLGWTLKMRPERTTDGKVRVACVVEQTALRGFINWGVPITVMQPAGILGKEKPRIATENRQLLPAFLNGRRELMFEPEDGKLVAKAVPSGTTGGIASGGETFVEGFADRLRSSDLPKLRIEVEAAPVETVAEGGGKEKEKGDYQIFVSTRFIETDEDPGEWHGKGHSIFTDPQFQVMIRALNQRRGVDLMNGPSQMFRDGDSKEVALIQEFIYPVSYDPPTFPPHEIKGDAKMFPVSPAVPKDTEKANVGMTVQVKASLRPNRMIELELSPRRTEFHEFLNFGGSIHHSENGKLTGVLISENRIEMPVFDVSSQRMKVRVPDGHTICLGGFVLDREFWVEHRLPVLGLVTNSKKVVKRRYIHVFITAQLVYPKGVPVN